MRVLITGASGFVGPHLARELLTAGHQIELTAPVKFELRHAGRSHIAHICDMLDQSAIKELVDKTKPDAVVHLAGLSHVHQGTQNRSKLVELNVTATGALCAAIAQSNVDVSFLFISSALMYPASSDGETVVNEETPPRPDLPYAFSKLAAENIARCYASDSFRVYVARPFNHIGPGQSRDFVCPGMAHRIATAVDGGSISVGNLNTKRDFTDVRDVARAYRLILEKRPDDRLFVIGSGKSTSIKSILDKLIEISGKKIVPQVDSSLLRSIDPPCFRSDYSLAQRALGWAPQISLETSLRDIYELERNLALQL